MFATNIAHFHKKKYLPVYFLYKNRFHFYFFMFYWYFRKQLFTLINKHIGIKYGGNPSGFSINIYL